MPRKGPGPTCAWTWPGTNKKCAMPVSVSGTWCHKHRGLVPRDEVRRAFIERSQREAITAEAKDSRRDFARVALEHGLDAPETREAYDKMCVANGPSAPVPAWWGKP